MGRTEVTLRRMTEDDVAAVVELAARDAAPADVLPPDAAPDPTTWTAARRDAYAAFLRSRLMPLPGGRSEVSFLVRAGGRTVGVARVLPSMSADDNEVGLWIGRRDRGRGIGGAVLCLIIDRVREAGGTSLVADTTTGNRAALAILRGHGATTAPSAAVAGVVDARIDLTRSRVSRVAEGRPRTCPPTPEP